MKELKTKGTNEKTLFFVAPSGLKVYLWNNPKRQNTYMSLTVKYGSRDTKFKCNNVEYEVPSGTAHYLEHLKFNMKDVKVSDLFFDLGLDYNAYTTTKNTTYEVYGNDNIYDGCKLLLDFVFDNYFTKALVENERNIILEEAKSKKDRPGFNFHQKTVENFYVNECYIPPVIGYEKDIKRISLEDISMVHDFFYRPENMFMVITGNFDPEKMEKVICDNEKDRKFNNIGKLEYSHPLETSKLKHKQYIVKDRKVKNTGGKLTIKTIVEEYKKVDQKDIYCALRVLLSANFGSTSDFYDQLILSGLASSLSTTVSIDLNTVNIEFNFSSEEPKKVFKLIKDKLKNMDFNEEDMIRIKRCIKASYILDYENIYNVADLLIASLINYDSHDDGFYEKFDKVNINQMKKIYKMVNLENYSEGIVSPE